GRDDLLVWGSQRAYVLLGPIELDTVEDIATRAEVIIDLSGGWVPVMGADDLSGDDLSDIAFSRKSSNGEFQVAVLRGNLEPKRNQSITSNGRLVISAAGLYGSPQVQLLLYGGNPFPEVLVAGTQVDANFQLPNGQPTENMAYVFDGDAVKGSLAAAITTALTNADSAVVVRHFKTQIESQWSELYPEYTSIGPHTPQFFPFTMTPSDIDGDGVDEILIGVEGDFTVVDGDGTPKYLTSAIYVLDNFNYAATPSSDFVSLDNADPHVSTLSRHLGRDPTSPAFAPSRAITNLGDINRDGLEDFAVHARTESNSASTSNLLIFYGDRGYVSEFNGGIDPLLPLSAADIKLRSFPETAYTSSDDGAVITSDVAAGDFDGDGRVDLAIGRNQTIIKSGLSIVDTNNRGSLNLLWNVSDTAAALGGTVLLGNSSINVTGDARQDTLSLTGVSDGDRFGQLLKGNRVDLDGDGRDDLLIGAASADVLAANVVGNAGAVYALYGSPRRLTLPSAPLLYGAPLANQTLSGRDFLVADGTGRAVEFNRSLTTGFDQFLPFTTLGDGQSSNTLRLTPSADRPRTAIIDGRAGYRNTIDNANGSFTTAGSTFNAGGVAGYEAAIEFDLSSLLEAYDDVNAIGPIELSLDARVTRQPFSSPSFLTSPALFGAVSTKSYFTASTPDFGNELWVYDGTTRTTGMLADLQPGSSGISLNQSAMNGDRLYFTTNNPTGLWTTDGLSDPELITSDFQDIKALFPFLNSAVFLAG
ncbi:MAG: FG-GAP repeat protein, partial [Planctomycetales bacterium]|nr:FG-GAP repeat protein [Planctomycetales bacterium]